MVQSASYSVLPFRKVHVPRGKTNMRLDSALRAS